MAPLAWTPRRVVPLFLLFIGCSVAARPAGAYPLRNPQVLFNTAGLQQQLDTWDEGIHAATDQVELQVFSTIPLGQALSFYLARQSGAEIGVYAPSVAGVPTPLPLFAATSGAGSFSSLTFKSNGTVIVSRFDSLFVLLGTTSHPWPGGPDFGLCVSGPDGTWYSQDARNGGVPHALTYAGTGVNSYGLFECFEPRAFDPADPEAFTGILLFVERTTCRSAQRPGFGSTGTECSPVVSSTWGGLKLRYR